MSLTDDRIAEFETKLDRARQRCLYGKTYSPAHELARRIKTIRKILWKREHIDNIPNLNWWEREFTMQTGGILLMAAINTSQKLREVADALDAEEIESPGQANILKAYEDCIDGRYPPTIVERGNCFLRCSVPTLAQLRDAFIRRFGQNCWPSDFGARKTIRTLGLPLSKGKKGRPVGSRSVIRNPKD